MRTRARPAAMETAMGPAGQPAIGGSKGRTGAKGEAAVPPGACSAPLPPRWKSEGGRGLFTKRRIQPEFLAALLTYTTLDTSGAGSARCTERGGWAQGPNTPPPHASSREHLTAPRRGWSHMWYPRAGLGWRGQESGARKQFPKARAYSSRRS